MRTRYARDGLVLGQFQTYTAQFFIFSHALFFRIRFIQLKDPVKLYKSLVNKQRDMNYTLLNLLGKNLRYWSYVNTKLSGKGWQNQTEWKNTWTITTGVAESLSIHFNKNYNTSITNRNIDLHTLANDVDSIIHCKRWRWI